MLDTIIRCTAKNYQIALEIANALQASIYCEVFSVTLLSHGVYEVWAKAEAENISIKEIDKRIEDALSELV
jgi:sulfur relay (sulfurtransferase) DsrF/TusC family protein